MSWIVTEEEGEIIAELTPRKKPREIELVWGEKLVFGKEKKNFFPGNQEERGGYVAEGHGCSCCFSLFFLIWFNGF